MSGVDPCPQTRTVPLHFTRSRPIEPSRVVHNNTSHTDPVLSGTFSHLNSGTFLATCMLFFGEPFRTEFAHSRGSSLFSACQNLESPRRPTPGVSEASLSVSATTIRWSWVLSKYKGDSELKPAFLSLCFLTSGALRPASSPSHHGLSPALDHNLSNHFLLSVVLPQQPEEQLLCTFLLKFL